MNRIFDFDFEFDFRPILKVIAEVLASRPNVIPGVAGIVLVSGLLLSLFWHCSAFSRSGGVLVSLSLAVVYVNHFFIQEIEAKESGDKHRIKDGENLGEYEAAKRRLTALYPSISDAHVHDAASMMSFVFSQNQSELYELKAVKEKITFWEFAAGVTGTLVWAIGDIPFCVLA